MAYTWLSPGFGMELLFAMRYYKVMLQLVLEGF